MQYSGRTRVGALRRCLRRQGTGRGSSFRSYPGSQTGTDERCRTGLAHQSTNCPDAVLVPVGHARFQAAGVPRTGLARVKKKDESKGGEATASPRFFISYTSIKKGAVSTYVQFCPAMTMASPSRNALYGMP